MIGSTVAPGSTYELMRWARRMVRAHGLKPNQACVLYVLVSYADPRQLPVKAWPSLRTLAEDAGYKPSWCAPRYDGKRQKPGHWKCNPVSSVLGTLQERQIIWTERGGRGGSSVHELLYRPPVNEGVNDSGKPPEHKGDNALIEAPSGEGVNNVGSLNGGSCLPAVGVEKNQDGKSQHDGKSQKTKEPSMPPPVRGGIPALDQGDNEIGPERAFVRAAAARSLREAAA